MQTKHGYLKRLPAAHYQRQTYVHWSLTIQDRKQGWLIPTLHYKFRELLTHAAFRYGFCCPTYCCMPDHIHLLWIGILDSCDQRVAMRYFRKRMNLALAKVGARLQLQPYDHVLTENDRDHDAFEAVADYIVRNPERRGLVPIDGFASYSYSGCLIPGYPELKLFGHDYWERMWRAYAYLLKNGLISCGSGR
jgi:putative transposase